MSNERMTIEIDCPPGPARPDTYLPQVLAGTGIEPSQLIEAGRCFGNWTWEVPDDLRDKYIEVRETIKQRISALYHAGCIRYGSW